MNHAAHATKMIRVGSKLKPFMKLIRNVAKPNLERNYAACATKMINLKPICAIMILFEAIITSVLQQQCFDQIAVW